jgi:RNA polymerase sigma factor for flagellar operon FliA
MSKDAAQSVEEIADLWNRYQASGDSGALEGLVVHYQRLVKYVVDRLAITRPVILDIEDLVSYGNIGLLEAIDRFDAARGVKFETFAIRRIRGTIVDQLRALDWLPRSARRRVKEIQSASAELTSTLGRIPTDEEVASFCSLNEKRFQRATAAAAIVTVSLDAVLHLDEDERPLSIAESVEDGALVDPLHVTTRNEMVIALRKAINSLPTRESAVIVEHYGSERTMREIGKQLELSESRVCQLHAIALDKLNASLQSYVQEGNVIQLETATRELAAIA